MAVPRLPSPLIKPDVRISRIRLSDWLHLAHWRRCANVHPTKPEHAQLAEDHMRPRIAGCRARAPCDAGSGSCARGS